MAKIKAFAEPAEAPVLVGAHGARRLPRVEIDGYNLELKDNGRFLGDRASKKALYALLDKWRKPLAKEGKYPFSSRQSRQIGKGELDEALTTAIRNGLAWFTRSSRISRRSSPSSSRDS